MLALKATIGVRVSEDVTRTAVWICLSTQTAYSSGSATWPGTDWRIRWLRSSDDKSTDSVERIGVKDWEMKLIIAFIKPFKLEQVRDALKTAGVSGMSVSDVSGFGRQEPDRGLPGCQYEVEFVPKVDYVEVIVTDELAGPAVAAIESRRTPGGWRRQDRRRAGRRRGTHPYQ